MYFQSKASALRSALRTIDRDVDADQLIDRAGQLGIKLPVEATANTTAMSINGRRGGIHYKIDDLAELAKAVDQVVAGKRAA